MNFLDGKKLNDIIGGSTLALIFGMLFCQPLISEEEIPDENVESKHLGFWLQHCNCLQQQSEESDGVKSQELQMHNLYGINRAVV